MLQYLIKVKQLENHWIDSLEKSKHWKARAVKTKSKITKKAATY